MGKCDEIIKEMTELLPKHLLKDDGADRRAKGVLRQMQWAVSSGDKMAKLRSTLEAHKSGLQIALQLIFLDIVTSIKMDTVHLPSIEHDVSEILQALKSRSSCGYGGRPETSSFALQRFLESSTTYAESVCNALDEERESLIEASFTTSKPRRDPRWRWTAEAKQTSTLR